MFERWKWLSDHAKNSGCQPSASNPGTGKGRISNGQTGQKTRCHVRRVPIPNYPEKQPHQRFHHGRNCQRRRPQRRAVPKAAELAQRIKSVPISHGKTKQPNPYTNSLSPLTHFRSYRLWVNFELFKQLRQQLGFSQKLQFYASRGTLKGEK